MIATGLMVAETSLPMGPQCLKKDKYQLLLVFMPGAVHWLCSEKELEKTNPQILRGALFGWVIVRTGCASSCGGGRGRDPLDGGASQWDLRNSYLGCA